MAAELGNGEHGPVVFVGQVRPLASGRVAVDRRTIAVGSCLLPCVRHDNLALFALGRDQGGVQIAAPRLRLAVVCTRVYSTAGVVVRTSACTIQS